MYLFKILKNTCLCLPLGSNMCFIKKYKRYDSLTLAFNSKVNVSIRASRAPFSCGKYHTFLITFDALSSVQLIFYCCSGQCRFMCDVHRDFNLYLVNKLLAARLASWSQNIWCLCLFMIINYVKYINNLCSVEEQIRA
jgi:hypothetical protein